MKRPTIQLAELVGELVPTNDPVNDEAAQPPAADLVQWIDALALAMAAGVRAGQRGCSVPRRPPTAPMPLWRPDTIRR